MGMSYSGLFEDDLEKHPHGDLAMTHGGFPKLGVLFWGSV